MGHYFAFRETNKKEWGPDRPEYVQPSRAEFDKFVKDLERREQARRDAAQRLPSDHNAANRLRDARNREQLHNRIRWSR